jgi:hypothetical protein
MNLKIKKVSFTMNKNLLFATFVSALGGFLFGFDTAVISGTTEFLKPYFGLTDSTLGFTVSIALIGTVIGSIAAGKPGDIFGRRAILFLCGLFYFISAIGCGTAHNWYILLSSRFLGGLGIGAASVMAPIQYCRRNPCCFFFQLPSCEYRGQQLALDVRRHGVPVSRLLSAALFCAGKPALAC